MNYLMTSFFYYVCENQNYLRLILIAYYMFVFPEQVTFPIAVAKKPDIKETRKGLSVQGFEILSVVVGKT